MILASMSACALLAACGSADKAEDRIDLATVSRSDLSRKGVELREASDVEPKVSAEQAVQAMIRDGNIRSVTLGLLTDRNTIPPANGVLVWALEFDPTTLVTELYPGGLWSDYAWRDASAALDPPVVRYGIAFIDAMTGEEIDYVSETLIAVSTPSPAAVAPTGVIR